MTLLLNPYEVPAAPAGALLGRRARILGAAVFGAALAAGCSSDSEPDLSPAAPPVTMPVPTPSATPTPDAEADAEEGGDATADADADADADDGSAAGDDGDDGSADEAGGDDGSADEASPVTTGLSPAAPGQVQLTKPGADYTVMPGDTLSALAVQFGVPGGWPTLFELNRDVLWDPDLILVGQQLDIDGQ
jgi:nucleoid-associated protein YgaU